MAAGAACADEWHFVSIDGATVLGGAELVLGDDSGIAGSTGCNNFTGSATYSNGILTISQPLATTRKLCADPVMDGQERALLTLLNGQIEIDYDPFLEQLTLGGKGHSAELEAGPAKNDKMPAVFDAQKVNVSGLSGLLNFRSEPTTTADVVGRLRPGSVLANQGCERLTDRDWCRLSLEDGTEGWAAAEYLTPLTLGSRVKGGNYDRIGRLECAAADKAEVARCEYGASSDAGHTIVAVFIDTGSPIILHFRNGLFDAVSSFGPFAEGFSTETGEDAVTIVFGGIRLQVPNIALQL